MREEILKILDNYHVELQEAELITEELLNLHSVSGCSLEELQSLKKIYKEKVKGYSGVNNYREAHEENIRLGVIELLISKSNNR